MDFINKNWSKITLAAISFIGAIMMIIPLCMAPEFKFIGACQLIGVVLFFLGSGAFLVLKMLDTQKMATACTLLATGVLALIFLFVGIFGFTTKVDNEGETKAQGAIGYSYASFKASEASAKEYKETVQAQLTAAETQLAAVNTALEAAPTNAVLLGQKAAIEEGIATAKAGISKIETGVQTAKTAYTALLLTYVSLILAMGLMPIVAGSAKLVSAIRKED